MKPNLAIVLAAALVASKAIAAGGGPDGIRLGQPSYGGTACPAGSASATLSPDAQSLSILFDQYQVDAGGMSGKAVDRKSCNIAIPVTVPQGYSVSIIQIDYRGFNALPPGAQSRFSAEYFFAGSQGPSTVRDFYGPLNQDFMINNRLQAEAIVWSACGADVNLRANTGLMVQTNYNREQAMSTVDSADIRASVVFSLQWKRCDGGYVPPTVPPSVPPNNPPPNYPPAPVPVPGYTECSISSVTDYYGRVVYRVSDRYGRVLGDYYSYAEAENAARVFDNRGMCSDGGYNPRPPAPPRPTPRPPRPRPIPPGGQYGFTCTASTRYAQYVGHGPTANAAAADAVRSCMRSGQDSYTCNNAQVACYRN